MKPLVREALPSARAAAGMLRVPGRVGLGRWAQARCRAGGHRALEGCKGGRSELGVEELERASRGLWGGMWSRADISSLCLASACHGTHFTQSQQVVLLRRYDLRNKHGFRAEQLKRIQPRKED